MPSNVDKSASERGKQNKEELTSRNERKGRMIPATREQWAEVLATADKYY